MALITGRKTATEPDNVKAPTSVILEKNENGF